MLKNQIALFPSAMSDADDNSVAHAIFVGVEVRLKVIINAITIAVAKTDAHSGIGLANDADIGLVKAVCVSAG